MGVMSVGGEKVNVIPDSGVDAQPWHFFVECDILPRFEEGRAQDVIHPSMWVGIIIDCLGLKQRSHRVTGIRAVKTRMIVGQYRMLVL